MLTSDYVLITNLMRWLLFIHKIPLSSTCFEAQVLIFRRIQLYTCSIWYCHSLWEFLVACRYTTWVKMSTWGSKHVEENSTLWINNNQCIKLVINVESIHDARTEKHHVDLWLRIEEILRMKSTTASFQTTYLFIVVPVVGIIIIIIIIIIISSPRN